MIIPCYLNLLDPEIEVSVSTLLPSGGSWGNTRMVPGQQKSLDAPGLKNKL